MVARKVEGRIEGKGEEKKQWERDAPSMVLTGL